MPNTAREKWLQNRKSSGSGEAGVAAEALISFGGCSVFLGRAEGQ